jgi:general secretion pathway protein L
MSALTLPWAEGPRRRISAFLRWWLDGLKALLPAALRRALGEGGHWLMLTLDGEAVALTRVSEKGRVPIGLYPLTGGGEAPGRPLRDLGRAREVVLCLPEEQALVQRFTLPAAVEQNLRGVLGYTMDTNTPFSADQVYYDGRVATRDPQRRTLEVELSLVPRGFLDEVLGELDALGLRPDRVAVGDTGDACPAVNLLPPAARQRRFRFRRLLNLGLGSLAVGLAVALIALPLWEKRETMRALEAQLAAVGQEARAARRLRADLERVAENAGFLVDKRRSTPLVLAVLNEITYLIPDDTWVVNLRMRGGEIEIGGFSAASAALVPVLDASPFLRNVRFISPVTRDRIADAERFHLTADLSPEEVP